LTPLQTALDRRWLIQNRSSVLEFMIDLQWMGSEYMDYLSGDRGKEQVRLLALLIGAGYGLWRSAYLLSDSADRPKLYVNSIDFMDYLLRNNSIGFMQDMNLQDWVGGHYLTNAILRLNLVRPALKLENEVKPPSFDLVIRREEWGVEFARLRESIERLKEEIVRTNKPPEKVFAPRKRKSISKAAG
jgi:hypothetical protein